MLSILSSSLLYLACFGFYHANEKRTDFQYLKASETCRKLTGNGSWLLLAVSLFVAIEIQGVLRGIFVWICLLFLMGFLSLFIQAMKSPWHRPSAYIFAGLTIFSFVGVVL